MEVLRGSRNIHKPQNKQRQQAAAWNPQMSTCFCPFHRQPRHPPLALPRLTVCAPTLKAGGFSWWVERSWGGQRPQRPRPLQPLAAPRRIDRCWCPPSPPGAGRRPCLGRNGRVAGVLRLARPRPAAPCENSNPRPRAIRDPANPGHRQRERACCRPGRLPWAEGSGFAGVGGRMDPEGARAFARSGGGRGWGRWVAAMRVEWPPPPAAPERMLGGGECGRPLAPGP